MPFRHILGGSVRRVSDGENPSEESIPQRIVFSMLRILKSRASTYHDDIGMNWKAIPRDVSESKLAADVIRRRTLLITSVLML
jgi:hypothetical protein